MKQDKNPLTLLRGPLILISVVSALLVPYITQLSFQTLGLFALLCFGLAVTCFDLYFHFIENLRCFLKTRLETFVLDDVLKAIFDPEIGLIAISTTSFIGSSAMYNLASTDEQRVRLLQSGLWVSDPEDARTVLYQPGGIKMLLPQSILDWLFPTPSPLDKGKPMEHEWADKLPDSSDDESATDLYEEEKRSIRINQHPTMNEDEITDDRLPSCNAQSSMRWQEIVEEPIQSGHEFTHPEDIPRQNISEPPMPHEVVLSIIMAKIKAKLLEYRQRLPDTRTIGFTGATGALLLALQLRSSRRARDLLLNILQSLATAGLSSVVMASAAMIYANPRNEILSAELLAKQVSKSLKQHWKGCLAALILLVMRRKFSFQTQHR